MTRAVGKALASAPEERFATVGEFGAELGRVVPELVDLPRRRIRRRVAAAAAGVGLIGVIVAANLYADRERERWARTTGLMEIHTSSLVRTDGGDFLADGFSEGQTVWISGIAGPWTIATGLSASVMPLEGAALTPTIADPSIPSYFSVDLTVFGFDSDFDSGDGARIGGDRITVCSDFAGPGTLDTATPPGSSGRRRASTRALRDSHLTPKGDSQRSQSSRFAPRRSARSCLASAASCEAAHNRSIGSAR